MTPKTSKKDFAKMTVTELEKAIKRHNKLYFEKNAPEISDYEFDKLVQCLKKLKPDSLVLTDIPTDVNVSFKGFKKVRRERPMLSLDKAYSEEEVQK